MDRANHIVDANKMVTAPAEMPGGRSIWEVANQLGGYIGPSTPDDLVAFLSRESDAAAALAERIVSLESRALAAEAALAAERERAASIAEQFADEHAQFPALPHAGRAIAAAIRAQEG